jgi:antitoxin ParD1/3/4
MDVEFGSKQLEWPERWLRDEVVPVYDAMQADPTRALSADEVLGAIRSRHAARVKKAKRGP